MPIMFKKIIYFEIVLSLLFIGLLNEYIVIDDIHSLYLYWEWLILKSSTI